MNGVENTSWEELLVDQNQTEGQGRAIGNRYVKELVRHFMTKPMELELTVHLDQGTPSSLFSSGGRLCMVLH